MKEQATDSIKYNKTTYLKRIVWWSIMAATISVLRIIFSGIPNVQPLTVMIIWITCIVGFSDGFVIAILSILLSNIYLGLGTWTFGQFLAYTAIVMFSYVVIRPFYKRRIIAAGLAGITGYLFGFVYAIFQATIFGVDFIVYYVSGILFDTYHAIGNIGFYLLLYPVFVPIIQRFTTIFFKKRREYD